MSGHAAHEEPSKRRDDSAPGRLRELAVLLLLLTAVAIVYLPLEVLQGERLAGRDFAQLHQGRLEYARDWLEQGVWPAWYTREFLGAPFIANLQSVPWIPNRIPLYLFQPDAAYAVGVVLGAWLAALFTYLYARSLGMRRLGAALAGWTFACAGYYASRVLAGNLPILEAYAAFPLLLWLIEAARAPGRSRSSRLRWYMGLSLATASVAMSGNPQIPFYAVAGALLYSAFRGGALPAWLAMSLGVALSLVIWLPMLHLISESSRLLPLEIHPLRNNDIAFPLWRLTAFVAPWAHGRPDPHGDPPATFVHPNSAVFWDTVCYTGIAPLAAVAALAIVRARERSWLDPPAATLAVIAILALVTALPWAEWLSLGGKIIILRSPARQLYLTTLGLAVALGWGIDAVLRRPRPMLRVLAAAVIAAHGLDLGHHARAFIRTYPGPIPFPGRLVSILEEELDDGRVVVERQLAVRTRLAYDHIGFFDPVPMARPFLALHALEDRPLFETERIEGTSLSPATMARFGARFVLTRRPRADLELRALAGGVRLYAVPEPSPRVRFYSLDQVEVVEQSLLLERLREAPPAAERLLLPESAGSELPSTEPGGTRWEAALEHERPEPDRISISVESAAPGVVRVLESWSPGWRARVDGEPASVLPADGFAIAVPVAAGAHRVELEFRTPGRVMGLALALLGTPALGWLLCRTLRGREGCPSFHPNE